MQGIKDTSTETFRKIMGNGLTYEVPKFQRDYSWNNEQWDDLWQDLEALENGKENAHYMGYLVLQTSDNKHYRIIDGQQRLSTICVMILAGLKVLKDKEISGVESENNAKRREQLRSSYIGYLDPVTLIPNNKLKLNRNNDKFYKTYLVPLEKIPLRGLNASERLLKKCFEWYFTKLNRTFKTGQEVTAFIDKIVDKLFFTVITVGDELNAYKVFETLNARGVQLSSSDLLKNYLFSIVDSDSTHDTEFEQLETLWGDIINKLGSEKLPDFIRYYWNSQNKTTRKNDLFKTIKKGVDKKQKVFELLRDLLEKADVFIALKNPEDEFWGSDNEIRNYLKELKIFGAKQPLSLLLSAYSNLNKEKFRSVLKICSVIYFRYNIIGGLNPNEEEIIFNRIANYIHQNKDFNKSDFDSIYPKDDEFENDFSNKQLKTSSRDSKITKYILTKVENHLSGTDFDFASERNTIEHILPENPSEEWDISDEEIERSRYRLGNLTLLERGKNNNLKNKTYSEKTVVFETSGFKSTKEIPDNYQNWNESSIINRQKRLARKAKTIWKIQF